MIVSRNWFALLTFEYLILTVDISIVRRPALFAIEFLWKVVATGLSLYVLLLFSSPLEMFIVAPVLILANCVGLALSWLGRRGVIEVESLRAI